MLEWYSNKYVGIFFDDVPKVAIRYILPSTSKEIKKSIKKYPFINKKLLKVELIDLKKDKKWVYNFLEKKDIKLDDVFFAFYKDKNIFIIKNDDLL